MTEKTAAQTTFEDRYGLYLDHLGEDVPPREIIATIVSEAGELLERVFGEAVTEEAMRVFIGEDVAEPYETWKDALVETVIDDLPITQALGALYAYGCYGICSYADEESTEDQLEEGLRRRLVAAREFEKSVPVSLWLHGTVKELFERYILLSSARWALDHGQPVDATALAILGGVSIGRMRNMVSGKSAVFHAEEGRVSAHEALEWLEGREAFYPSIWRSARPEPTDLPDWLTEPVETPIFVPETRDGHVFHPGLARSGGYTVGAKGAEERHETFEEALNALTHMPVPRWRQPGKGEAASWSLVTGVTWKRTTRSELDVMARSMQALHAAGEGAESMGAS